LLDELDRDRYHGAMNDEYEDYITVEEVADILGVTIRQANKYGAGPEPKINTKRAGKRIMYLRADVDRIARERNITPYTPKTRPIKVSVASGPVWDEFQALQDRLQQSQRRIGQLEGELNASRYMLDDSRKSRDDLDRTRDELTIIRSERDELRGRVAELERAKYEQDQLLQRLTQLEYDLRPWWKKLFFGKD
jgi:hypothetical protein